MYIYYFIRTDPQAPQPQASQASTPTSAPASNSTPNPASNSTQNPASNSTQPPASNSTQTPASNSTQTPASNSTASNSTQIPAIASRPTFIFTNSLPLYGKIGFDVVFTWRYDGQFDFLTQSLVTVAIFNSSSNKNWTIDSNLSTSATSSTWVTSKIVNPSLIGGPYSFAIFNGSEYFSGRPVAPLVRLPFTMYQPGQSTSVGYYGGTTINTPTLITFGISLLTALFTYIQYNNHF
ncbi:hypothetical protein F8M41_011185 [Gigaspora margarita]|uniref:DUF7137 domain-containing protein n=1 Tax=Gigaspora margarita TaxID=4874 RepID=A0A8H4A2N6_GIGMA|nr:hypothetical protein F8M41_011185 [Gigaspora margarita]